MPDSDPDGRASLRREWGVHVVANATERNFEARGKMECRLFFCSPKRLTKIGPFPLKLPALNMMDQIGRGRGCNDR